MRLLLVPSIALGLVATPALRLPRSGRAGRAAACSMVAGPRGPVERFTAPIIDDPALPLSDLVIAGAACPAIISATVLVLGLPRPSWLVPGVGVVGCTLLHGTKLASCWLAGALAARAWEAEAFEGSRERAVATTWSAGAFAVGLLVFSTQLQLFVSFGFDLSGALGYPAEPSLEADLELVRAQSELIVDAFFEAVIMTAWRVYHHASWRELP